MPDFNLPVDENDAAARFEKWKETDPFPRICPALLNSRDIIDYVSTTGMLFPFRPDQSSEKLKTASYEVDLLGEYRWWDASGKERRGRIARGDEFVLQRNSIAFVQVEPIFRVPAYIALRFNLRIKHVYRGLLLGTGPLVDPGFQGPLYIPLHNLTSNEYVLKGGEGLIWMEFTKLSTATWTNPRIESPERNGIIVSFPPRKENQELDYYLCKAAPSRSIRSSIPLETEVARQHAEAARGDAANAREQAESAKGEAKRSATWAQGLTIAVAIAAAALVLNMWNFVTSAQNFVNSRAGGLDQRIEKLLQKSEQLEKSAVDSDGISRRIDKLSNEVDQLRKEVQVSQIPSTHPSVPLITQSPPAPGSGKRATPMQATTQSTSAPTSTQP